MVKETWSIFCVVSAPGQGETQTAFKPPVIQIKGDLHPLRREN